MRQATIDYIIKNKRCICGHEIKKDSSEYFALMEQRNYLPPADVGSIIGDFERTANRWYRKGDELLEEIDDCLLYTSTMPQPLFQNRRRFIGHWTGQTEMQQ